MVAIVGYVHSIYVTCLCDANVISHELMVASVVPLTVYVMSSCDASDITSKLSLCFLYVRVCI